MSESTVESAWTIGKISGTLSWFEVNINQILYPFSIQLINFEFFGFKDFYFNQTSGRLFSSSQSVLSPLPKFPVVAQSNRGHKDHSKSRPFLRFKVFPSD